MACQAVQGHSSNVKALVADASRAALPIGREPGEAIVHANAAANDDFSMLLQSKISGLRLNGRVNTPPPLKSGTVINKGVYPKRGRFGYAKSVETSPSNRAAALVAI